MAKFCPYCGKKLGDADAFCSACGKAFPLREAAVQEELRRRSQAGARGQSRRRGGELQGMGEPRRGSYGELRPRWRVLDYLPQFVIGGLIGLGLSRLLFHDSGSRAPVDSRRESPDFRQDDLQDWGHSIGNEVYADAVHRQDGSYTESSRYDDDDDDDYDDIYDDGIYDDDDDDGDYDDVYDDDDDREDYDYDDDYGNDDYYDEDAYSDDGDDGDDW